MQPPSGGDRAASLQVPIAQTGRFTAIPPSAFRRSGYAQRRAVEPAARGWHLAEVLGWFGIGFGLAQVLAPRAVSRAIGVNDRPLLMRAFGVRELASGIGILSQNASRKKTAGWLWLRVAGDAMDLAMLGAALASQRNLPRHRRSRVMMASAAAVGVTALDVLAGACQSEQNKSDRYRSESGALFIEKYVTVNRSAEECYRYWRDFNNFGNFMTHVESVRALSDARSRWKAKAPLGRSVEWESELTADQPNEFLAWHSLEGADIEHAGSVRFERALGGRGTVVRVQMQYSPPGGRAGALAARLFGEEPGQQVDDDLRHFKQLIETGVIPTTVGQTSGPRSMKTRLLLKKGVPG